MNNENEAEQDEMAYDYLDLGPQYFALSSAGKPVAGGQIFIGNVNTDPEIPANQKQVQLILENGSRVDVDQPVRTGAGGVIEYNGSPAIMTTDGDYSMKVLSSNGAQLYYFAEKKATGIPSVNVQDSIILIDGTSPNPSIGYIDHPSDGIYHTGTTINIKQGGGDSPIASLDDIASNSVASVNPGNYTNITGTPSDPIVNVDSSLLTYIDDKASRSDSASSASLVDCDDLQSILADGGVSYQVFDSNTLNHPSGFSGVGAGIGFIQNIQVADQAGLKQIAHYSPDASMFPAKTKERYFYTTGAGWGPWREMATGDDVQSAIGFHDVDFFDSGVEYNATADNNGDLTIIKTSSAGAYVKFPEESVSGMRAGSLFTYMLDSSSSNTGGEVQIEGLNWAIVDRSGAPTTSLGLGQAGDLSTVVVTSVSPPVLTVYGSRAIAPNPASTRGLIYHVVSGISVVAPNVNAGASWSLGIPGSGADIELQSLADNIPSDVVAINLRVDYDITSPNSSATFHSLNVTTSNSYAYFYRGGFAQQRIYESKYITTEYDKSDQTINIKVDDNGSVTSDVNSFGWSTVKVVGYYR